MLAVQVNSAGEPSTLSSAEIPAPVIRDDNEVLVRIAGASVNPIDLKLRQRGLFLGGSYPAILGCDAASTVEAVGPAVTQFRPGDRVWYCYGGLGHAPGNYAQWQVLSQRHLANAPSSIGLAEAGAGPLVLITAWEALHDRATMQAGNTVFIAAGTGGVGHVAIQLAKQAGCRVITSVSTHAKAALARTLGADEIIFYPEQDVGPAVLQLTDGQGADICFDTVGGKVLNDCIEAAALYGTVVSILDPPNDARWPQVRYKNLHMAFVLMLTPALAELSERQAHQRDILTQCAALVDSGALSLHVSQQLALADAAEAHRLIEAGQHTGKLVLIPPGKP